VIFKGDFPVIAKKLRDNSELFNGMSKWKNKVALVTGASSGIGRKVALALGQAGMKVAVTGRRKDRLIELVGLLNDSEAEGLAIPADFSREQDITGVFKRIRAEWGGTHVLINSAGLGYKQTLAQISAKSMREMVDVNVLALTICMQEAIKDMEPSGLGQIINISSMAAHRVPHGGASPMVGMYSATKHAVKAITEAMWGELASKGSPIKIGTISPGIVDGTEFHQKAGADAIGIKMLNLDDIVDVVFYLLSTPAHVQVSDVMMRPIGQKS